MVQNLVVDVFVNALSIAGPAASIASTTAKVANEGAKIGEKLVHEISQEVQNGMSLAEQILLLSHSMGKTIFVSELISELKGTAGENESQYVKTSLAAGDSELVLPNTPIYQTDICSAFGGNKKNEDPARIANMNFWISKTFPALRGTISTFSNRILNPKGNATKSVDGWHNAAPGWNSPLAYALDQSDVRAAEERMRNDPEHYET
jgi:hypothetical protein